MIYCFDGEDSFEVGMLYFLMDHVDYSACWHIQHRCSHSIYCYYLVYNFMRFNFFQKFLVPASLIPTLISTKQIHQLIDPDMYWFAIPNIGSILKGLSQVT